MTNGTAKKGLSTGAKIAIGCGVAIVLGMIAVTLLLGWGVSKAKQYAEEHERNAADDRTSEEAATSAESVAEGALSMTVSEGEYSIDASDQGEGGTTFSGPEAETRVDASASLENVPDWVPLYPGTTSVTSTYSTQTSEGLVGTVNLVTGDPSATVIDHYETWFDENDYSTGNRTDYARGDQLFGGINGELEGRTVSIGAVEQAGNTEVTINYNAKE